MNSPNESGAARTGNAPRHGIVCKHSFWELICAIALLFYMAIVAASPLFAQSVDAPNATPQPTEDEPPTRRLTLYPAAEPRPALKYQLLPSLLDRRPGNAAVLYNKIGLTFRGGPEFREEQEKVSEWCDDELPLDKFPREEARKVVEHWRQVLDGLEYASRRETCDWELPFRERNPIMMQLNDVQDSRGYARLLRLQARLQIADGDLEGAIATLRTGYALARHVAQGETFIHALIGMAMSGIMNSQLEELVSQPGAPNLYWALTSLPRPFIDLRISVEEEYSLLYLIYPELRDIGSQRHPPEYWDRLFDRFSADVAQWNDDAWKNHGKLIMVARGLRNYPEAKRRLAEAGRSAEEVSAMPVAQAAILYSLQLYEEARDNEFKWLNLPYWEAAPAFEKLRAAAIEMQEREIIPWFSVLAPSTGAVSMAAGRTERWFAMLRTYEALRLYAAAHDGRAPQRLEDVVEAPVPRDPLSDKPFLYRVEGDTAILEAPHFPGMSLKAHGKRYEIQFSR